MKRYITVIICLIFTSCYHPNKQWYEDRDTIHFEDSIEDVEASIVKLNSLFDKIRKDYNDSIYIKYYWSSRDTNEFIFCDTNVIGLNVQNIGKLSYTKSLSTDEIEDLVRLIYYLESNFLNSCRCECNKGIYLYDYRFIENETYFSRDIFYFGKSLDTINMSFRFKFLDRKGNLMLTKFKD